MASAVWWRPCSVLSNTTFAQNNGVIQMTGVASRYVGRYIGVILILLGLFPRWANCCGRSRRRCWGATMVMFGCVVAAGIRIITQTPLSRRDVLIVGLAFGAGLGVESVPAFLIIFRRWSAICSSSAATSGGLVAIAEPYSAAGAGGDEIVKESG